MALGCFLVAVSYLIMAAAAWHAGAGKASWLWLFAYFVVITVGELYLSPIGLSLVTKLAPARILSMMMGVWLATSFIGNFLAGWLGSFWSRMEKPEFFLLIAAIAALAGAAIFAGAMAAARNIAGIKNLSPHAGRGVAVAHVDMIRKSGSRFSEKIMFHPKACAAQEFSARQRPPRLPPLVGFSMAVMWLFTAFCTFSKARTSI